MTYVAGAYAPDTSVRNVLWFDAASLAPEHIQDGSLARPYASLQAGIDYVITQTGTRWRLMLAPGVYLGDLTIPQNLELVFEGADRRGTITVTGSVHWTVSGSNTSRLVFRDMTIDGVLEVLDGDPPASPATLRAESCELSSASSAEVIRAASGSVSSLVIVVTGMSSAGLPLTADPDAETELRGAIQVEQGVLYLAGTHLGPSSVPLRVGTLRAVQCAIEQDIEITSPTTSRAEFIGCSFPTPGRSITFTGAPGVAYFDDLAGYMADQAGVTVVNGSRDGGGLYYGRVTMDGTWCLRKKLAPPALAVDTHNYAPAGIGGVVRLQLSSSAGVKIDLTGLAAGVDGQVILLEYVTGVAGLDLTNDDPRSLPQNRFATRKDIAYKMVAGQGGWLVYDGAAQRWRVK